MEMQPISAPLGEFLWRLPINYYLTTKPPTLLIPHLTRYPFLTLQDGTAPTGSTRFIFTVIRRRSCAKASAAKARTNAQKLSVDCRQGEGFDLSLICQVYALSGR